MALFDPYTTKILLEATTKKTSKLVGGSGGAGGGPKKRKESLVKPGSPGHTIMFGDTKMPSGPFSGPDIYTQAGWSNYARMLNQALDGTTAGGAIGAVSSLLGSMPIPGMAKTGISTIAGGVTKALGSGGPMGSGLLDFAAKQAIKTGVANTYLTGFGKLGSKVSSKLPGLAAVGIDPLDWSLKAFGADAAFQGLQNIPSKTQAALQSPLGYLQKGKSRGIY